MTLDVFILKTSLFKLVTLFQFTFRIAAATDGLNRRSSRRRRRESRGRFAPRKQNGGSRKVSNSIPISLRSFQRPNNSGPLDAA